MIEFSRYDVATGRIIARGRCPVSMIEWQTEDGTGLLRGAHDPARVMVVSGVVQARPLFPIKHTALSIAAGGLDTVEFAGLPAGTEATIIGAGDPLVVTIDDGELHFDADSPGEYAITFRLWPFQDLRVEVHAS